MKRLMWMFLSLAPGVLYGQLTADQKVSDFQYMAGVFAKKYGPYEWKVQTQKFDLMNLAPWLAKVNATKTDLEFYDVMSEYVASLNDAHDFYSIPSDFIAKLNFFVDIFDGKLLVEYIDRNRLPAEEFGAVPGYELVSIDGVDAQRILEKMLRYGISGNERSTKRWAATFITYRPQSTIPSAPDVPEISTVVFRRPDGRLETYRMPWSRSGLPLSTIGKFKSPAAARPAVWPVGPVDPEALLQRLNYLRVPDRMVINFGSPTPAFFNALGVGFALRSFSPFFSGVFTVGAYRIGYIRIGDFLPLSTSSAVTGFQNQITYFQGNTDGLVVDVMSNGGGDGAYGNMLLSYLMPSPWTAIGFELRATSDWIFRFSSFIESLKAVGAPASQIAVYQQMVDELVSANAQARGMTKAISIDGVPLQREPAKDARGNVIAYTKPVMLLTDELSASAAEAFAAGFQDNHRGPVFGMRTMGAGGNVESWEAGSYSQGSVALTESLMSRSQDVVTDDFPVTRYVENVGVRPDIVYDYMTASNRRKDGSEFLDAMLLAIYQHIQNSAK